MGPASFAGEIVCMPAVEVPVPNGGEDEVEEEEGSTMGIAGREMPTVCTCILHFISSTGVSMKDVKAPLAAPQNTNALMGRSPSLSSNG